MQPDLSPLPAWGDVSRWPQRPDNRSFVSGDPNGQRLRCAWYPASDVVYGRVWFGPLSEGPKGFAHGGSMAAVLDELMGAVCWHLGYPVLAGTLNVRFRRPLPLGTVAAVEARIADVSGRKLTVESQLTLVDGTPITTASGLFVELAPERMGDLEEAARAAIARRRN